MLSLKVQGLVSSGFYGYFFFSVEETREEMGLNWGKREETGNKGRNYGHSIFPGYLNHHYASLSCLQATLCSFQSMLIQVLNDKTTHLIWLVRNSRELRGNQG